jgi:hypothetical protein
MGNLLYIDLGDLLTRIEERYGLSLPRRIVTAKYDRYTGSLIIKFRRRTPMYEDTTWDGLVKLYYGEGGGVVALKVLDISML